MDSVLLGVEAEVLIDAINALIDVVEPDTVVVNGYRYGMNVFPHADEFCLNAVQGLGKNANLGLCFLVPCRGFGAHFLEKTNGMVFEGVIHISIYIILKRKIPAFKFREKTALTRRPPCDRERECRGALPCRRDCR